MTEAHDLAQKHIWEFSADWRDNETQHFRSGHVNARNMAEAETLAKRETSQTANINVRFSGWNR